MTTTMETKRLFIRNFQTNDWQALYNLIIQYQASELAAYDQQWPTSQEKIRGITEWFASGDNFLAVCLKDADTFIGFVALNPEQEKFYREFNLGYIFNSKFHGQGYATEACTAILNHAFLQLKADRVVTGTASANHASCRLLERLGFRKAGEKIASFKTTEDGKPIEFVGYRYILSKDEWEKKEI